MRNKVKVEEPLQEISSYDAGMVVPVMVFKMVTD